MPALDGLDVACLPRFKGGGRWGMGCVRWRRGAWAVVLVAAGCGADPGTPTTGPRGDASVAVDAGVPHAAADSALGPPVADGAVPLAPSRLTDSADYLVTVVTAGWDAPEGELRRYRRGDEGWVPDGPVISIILGRSGLGWGRGLHGAGSPGAFAGPVKREGDGRSPAGAFWLDRALGYAAEAPPGTEITYQAMTPTLQCIEDLTSAHYNRIVDRALTAPDWDSTDRLLRDDGLYEFLLFVNQNTDPVPVPGAGSCILLHVWSSPTTPTAGCTSMERAQLREVVRGLGPANNLLVQLPGPVYGRVADGWGLPVPE